MPDAPGLTLTLQDALVGQVFGYFIVFARIGSAFMVMPAFAERGVPARVRLVAGLLLSVALAPAVPGVPTTIPDAPGMLTGLVLVEVTIGFMLGLWTRTLFASIHTAATIIAQQISLAQFFEGAALETSAPSVGNLLLVTALVLLFALDLHHEMLGALLNSYALIPLGGAVVWGDLASAMLEAFAAAFTLGVQLSLPFVLVAFVLYIGLGFINRAMPQMMVFFIATPALTGVGLMLLLSALPVILLAWGERFAQLLMAW